MGHNVGADLLNVLADVASWFGLGHVVDSAVRYISDGTGSYELSASKVNKLIDDMVREAKKQGQDTVRKLESRLSGLINTVPKSNTIRNAIDRALGSLSDELTKARNIVDEAESRISDAKMDAMNIDSLPETQKQSWGGKASAIQERALNTAQEAINKFNEMEKIS